MKIVLKKATQDKVITVVVPTPNKHLLRDRELAQMVLLELRSKCTYSVTKVITTKV